METISLYSKDKDKALWISNMSLIFLIYDGIYVSESETQVIFTVNSFLDFRIFISLDSEGSNDYSNFIKQYDNKKFETLFNITKGYHSFYNLEYFSLNSLDFYSYLFLYKAFGFVVLDNIITDYIILKKVQSLFILNDLIVSFPPSDQCDLHINSYNSEGNVLPLITHKLKRSSSSSNKIIVSLNSSQFNQILCSADFDTSQVILFLIDIVDNEPIDSDFNIILNQFVCIHEASYSIFFRPI